MKIPYYLIFTFLIVFFSCEKAEMPVNIEGCTDPAASNFNQYANISNNTICNYESFTKTIHLNSDYRYQVFYNINNNMIVSTNLKTDWDLSFENGDEGYRISINSSTLSQIAIVNNIEFENVDNTLNLIWKWDNPNGDLDSTAIGDHRGLSNTVWVIDRGYTASGNQRGYKKFMIDTVNNNYYKIRYSNLDNSQDTTITIYKEKDRNFTQFSFDTNSQIQIEPLDNTWNLLFTQYTHLYTGNVDLPMYLVTGVLINSFSDIRVAIDSLNEFENINYNLINNYIFSNKKNTIGYNWKYYDFNNQAYIIKKHINFIIKDASNQYFKLRFIDFYNDLGEKGFPKFEAQKL